MASALPGSAEIQVQVNTVQQASGLSRISVGEKHTHGGSSCTSLCDDHRIGDSE
jgi:hypothetical protein